MLRTWDTADLEWKVEGSWYRVFVLTYDESIQTKQSSVYDHRELGPALVVIVIGPNNTTVDVHATHDKKIWGWIMRLMRDGLKAYDQDVEIITPIDRKPDRVRRFGVRKES